MIDLGPHVVYIWGAYLIATVALGLFVIWLVADYQHQTGLLKDLNAEGMRRRSDRQGEKNPEQMSEIS